MSMVFQNPENQIVASVVEEEVALVQKTSVIKRGNKRARQLGIGRDWPC